MILVQSQFLAAVVGNCMTVLPVVVGVCVCVRNLTAPPYDGFFVC